MTSRITYHPRPDDSETKEAKIKFWKNKLSWKLPVTLRYAATFGGVFGMISLFRKRKIGRFVGHIAFWTPLFGFGLCIPEFYELYLAKRQ